MRRAMALGSIPRAKRHAAFEVLLRRGFQRAQVFLRVRDVRVDAVIGKLCALGAGGALGTMGTPCAVGALGTPATLGSRLASCTDCLLRPSAGILFAAVTTTFCIASSAVGAGVSAGADDDAGLIGASGDRYCGMTKKPARAAAARVPKAAGLHHDCRFARSPVPRNAESFPAARVTASCAA